MPSPRWFIVYGLADPDSDEIRYIGKSVSGLTRAKAHFAPATLERDGATHKAQWVRSVLARGRVPKVVVLAECRTQEQLFETERAFIALYGASGRLTNATEGGEGAPGRQVNERTRKKMARSARARARVPALDAAVLRAMRERHLAEVVEVQVERSEDHRNAQAHARGGRLFADQDGTTYMNVREAARRLGLHYQRILDVLKGRQRHTKGFVFTYQQS